MNNKRKEQLVQMILTHINTQDKKRLAQIEQETRAMVGQWYPDNLEMSTLEMSIMKPLANFRIEVELGIAIYPCSDHSIKVCRFQTSSGDWVYAMGGNPFDTDELYKTFEELLRDSGSLYGRQELASQPIWSTIKTPERLQYEQYWENFYKREYR
jgi:hypothetical protein